MAVFSSSQKRGSQQMNKNKNKTVTHRPKGNKKDISQEPETKELKRMIHAGELDPERMVEHLKREDNKQGESEGRGD
jgi:hypothetical protein